jgi:hypothetical protein
MLVGRALRHETPTWIGPPGLTPEENGTSDETGCGQCQSMVNTATHGTRTIMGPPGLTPEGTGVSVLMGCSNVRWERRSIGRATHDDGPSGIRRPWGGCSEGEREACGVYASHDIAASRRRKVRHGVACASRRS